MRCRPYAVILVLLCFVGCGEGSAPASPELAGHSDAPATNERAVAAQRSCIHESKCTAKKFAEGIVKVERTAWADGTLWASGVSTIVRIDASGTKTLKNGTGEPSELAVLGDTPFWTTGAALYKPTGGGGYEAVIYPEDRLDAPTNLTVVGSKLYFRQDDNIRWVDAKAATAHDYRLLFNEALVRASTVDAEGFVYWIEGDYDTPLRIKTYRDDEAITLGEVERLASVVAIAATPTHIFFHTIGEQDFLAVPKSEGVPFVVAERQGDTYRIVVDESGVYWTSRRGGLMRAELDGTGARQLLAVNWNDGVGDVAASPSALYFAQPSENAIYEVANS